MTGCACELGFCELVSCVSAYPEEERLPGAGEGSVASGPWATQACNILTVSVTAVGRTDSLIGHHMAVTALCCVAHNSSVFVLPDGMPTSRQ